MMDTIMQKVDKACPVVTRLGDHGEEVLAFVHPFAGKQFVKGTIDAGEAPAQAAARELREESGLVVPSAMQFLGATEIGPERLVWHFFYVFLLGLPEQWDHVTEDDGGHVFHFFWHRLDAPFDDTWHPLFSEAHSFFAPLIPRNGHRSGA